MEWGVLVKKKNPVVHLKQSDVKNLKNEATNIGIKYALVLFLSVMRDKEGYGLKRIKRVYKEALELADSINKGYVKWDDLEKALQVESDINIIL